MKNTTAWLILMLLALVWGSSFWLIKIGLAAFDSMQLGLLRVTISGLTLLPVAILALGKSKQYPWKALIAVGIIGNLLPALLFAKAQTVIPSSLAGMLNTTQPVFTLIIAFLFFQQRFTTKMIVSILLGCCGSVLLISINIDGIRLQDHVFFSLLVIAATFCYGISTNMIRRYLSDISPVEITALSLGSLLIPTSAMLFFSDIHTVFIAQQNWLNPFIAIVALGAIGTAFALILFNKLIQSRDTIFASMVTYLIPVVALFWGILDNEPMNWEHLLAVIVIFSALKMIDSANTQQRLKPVEMKK